MLYLQNFHTGSLFTVKEFEKLRKQVYVCSDDWKYIDICRRYTYKKDGVRYISLSKQGL